MSNYIKEITTTIDFIITCPSDNQGTHYLNSMRYHDASIENTYCHQPLLIMTQSIWIYDHFRVLPVGQRLMLILA